MLALVLAYADDDDWTSLLRAEQYVAELDPLAFEAGANASAGDGRQIGAQHPLQVSAVAVRCRYPAIGHQLGDRLHTKRVDERSLLTIGAEFTLPNLGTVAAIHHACGDRFEPDETERPIKVAQRSHRRLFPAHLTASTFRLCAVLGNRRRHVLDPVRVRNPVVEIVIGDRGDRRIAPARQQVAFDLLSGGIKSVAFTFGYGICRVCLLPQPGDNRRSVGSEGMLHSLGFNRGAGCDYGR